MQQALPRIPWIELLHRYHTALGDSWPWMIGVAVVYALIAVALVLRWPREPPRWVPVAALAATILFAVAWAWHLRWISDDAFISFRYADNLVEGRGLVFNEGERVEGYTNFLWTVLIAGAVFLGASPVVASLVLSLSSLAGLLVVTVRLVQLHTPPGSKVTVSFAAVAVGANYIIACYGSSGLETMLAAFLAALALERAVVQRPLAAGVSGILAVLAHPDHAIFYAALAVVVLLDDDRRRGFQRYAAPFFVVYVPYFLWKWHYYGDPFPNTYYAKSADLPYFTQGWVYVVVSALGSGLLGALPLAVVGAVKLRDDLIARYTVFATTLFVLYVAKIGGDFMFGRLLTPVIAPVLVLAELGARHLVVSQRRWVLVPGVPALAAMALAAVPTRVIRPFEKAWYIADERTFYRLVSVVPPVVESVYARWADDLNRFVKSHGVEPRIAVSSVGIIAYRTKLPMVDTYGLTDRTIARRKLARRGRPGHEKIASPGYLLSIGVDLSELPVYPRPYRPLTGFWINGYRYHMTGYRPELLRPLRAERHVSFLDFQKFLDGYDPLDPPKQADELSCDTWFFDRFYFRHANDERRRRRTSARIVEADPSLAGLEPFVLGDPGPHDGWTKVQSFAFESQQEGWTPTGRAFSEWPARHEAPGQDLVVGREGGFASSYTADGGDLSMGELVSPEFEISGDVVTFRIGGGRQPERLRVSLLVDGARVFSSTGCDSEVMGRRAWNVGSLAGQRAVIEIVDRSDTPWGHVVVDSIAQWKRTNR